MILFLSFQVSTAWLLGAYFPYYPVPNAYIQ